MEKLAPYHGSPSRHESWEAVAAMSIEHNDVPPKEHPEEKDENPEDSV